MRIDSPSDPIFRLIWKWTRLSGDLKWSSNNWQSISEGVMGIDWEGRDLESICDDEVARDWNGDVAERWMRKPEEETGCSEKICGLFTLPRRGEGREGKEGGGEREEERERKIQVHIEVSHRRGEKRTMETLFQIKWAQLHCNELIRRFETRCIEFDWNRMDSLHQTLFNCRYCWSMLANICLKICWRISRVCLTVDCNCKVGIAL